MTRNLDGGDECIAGLAAAVTATYPMTAYGIVGAVTLVISAKQRRLVRKEATLTPRAAIQQIGRMVRDDIRSGELSIGAHSVGDMLVEQPETLLLIVDLAAAEGRKKQPDESMYLAYSFMLGQTLEQLRQRSEAGQGQATAALEDVRVAIARQMRTGKLRPTVAVALVSSFTRAGIEAGEDVRAALDEAMIRTENAYPGLAMPDPAEVLRDLADACGGDPFTIQSEFAGMTAAMPAELQLMLLGGLVLADDICLREAAIGWLLADPAIATPLAKLIEAAAKRGLVTGASVAHLMVIRNWVAEDQRGAIDAIIKAARSIGSASKKRSAIQVRELLMSERDGAGAQTIFASIKEGRKHALVSILIKQGRGVRDAWVAPSSKGEVEDMLDHISAEMPIHETTAEDTALILGSALADGLAAGSVPPFGLVQAVTLIGLSNVTPCFISVNDLVASMLADVDAAATDAKATKKAVRTSGQWLATNPQLVSWFENGDDVGAAIKGKRRIEDRLTAIIANVLEPKRSYWASVIAWSAFAQRGDGDDSDWIEMALVARELASERPLTEMPIARYIAVQSAAAASG